MPDTLVPTTSNKIVTLLAGPTKPASKSGGSNAESNPETGLPEPDAFSKFFDAEVDNQEKLPASLEGVSPRVGMNASEEIEIEEGVLTENGLLVDGVTAEDDIAHVEYALGISQNAEKIQVGTINTSLSSENSEVPTESVRHIGMALPLDGLEPESISIDQIRSSKIGNIAQIDVASTSGTPTVPASEHAETSMIALSFNSEQLETTTLPLKPEMVPFSQRHEDPQGKIAEKTTWSETLPSWAAKPSNTSTQTSTDTQNEHPAIPVSLNDPTTLSQALTDQGLEQKFSLDIQSSIQTATSRSSELQNVPVFQRAETPKLVAKQLVEVVQNTSDSSIELSLNPKELGRVRMSLTALENGITVAITAERAETLDLMRRNIAALEQEFQELGYSEINFSFSQQNENQQEFASNQDQNGEGNNDGQAPDIDTPLSYKLTISPSDGIDIRV